MLYLLDSNVLICAHSQYYPIDRIPQFWNWLNGEGLAGRAKIPLEIYKEIDGKDDLLTKRVAEKETRNALILNEEVDDNILNDQVIRKGYAPDLNDAEFKQAGNDPFLVAYALMGENRCVVTKEVSKPSQTRGNRKIPDVCKELGVFCIIDFSFYKQHDFRIQ